MWLASGRRAENSARMHQLHPKKHDRFVCTSGNAKNLPKTTAGNVFFATVLDHSSANHPITPVKVRKNADITETLVFKESGNLSPLLPADFDKYTPAL